MFVAGVAAFNGNPGVAVGNAVGSNIANIALVLGISALASPLVVESKSLKREFPALVLVSLLVLVLIWDLELSRMDGFVLLGGTICLVAWMLWIAQKERSFGDPLEREFESELPHDMSTRVATLWTLTGLVLLVVSAQLLVWGAINIAQAFGVSDLLIGLTIIAIGTSLPEVAVSVTASIKGEDDIAIGNIIGSNMFNLLAVLGVAGSIEAATFSNEVLFRDYATMLALTVALFVMAYGFRGKGHINRFEASILLAAYIAYLGWLYISEISQRIASG
jgi:cation:H+ antiporter